MQFKKKFAFCLTKKKYAVSQPGPALGHFFTQPLIPELAVVGGDMTEKLQRRSSRMERHIHNPQGRGRAAPCLVPQVPSEAVRQGAELYEGYFLV